MAEFESFGGLELLGYQESRGVLGKRIEGSRDFEELVPTSNSVVLLHVRAPKGKPFCVTLDTATFLKEVLPFFSNDAVVNEALADG